MKHKYSVPEVRYREIVYGNEDFWNSPKMDAMIVRIFNRIAVLLAHGDELELNEKKEEEAE